MVNAEKYKYMEPKLSYSLKPLIIHFQINNILPTQHKNIIKTFKTITPYDSIEDNKPTSQSLCEQDALQCKPTTAANPSRIISGEPLHHNRKFIPMAVRYSMVAPSTAVNSVTHTRGASLERNVVRNREHLIASILRYAQ